MNQTNNPNQGGQKGGVQGSTGGTQGGGSGGSSGSQPRSNQGTQGNVGGTTQQGTTGGQGGEMKFVERVEMSFMQFVILNKAKEGGVTRENLQQVFRGNMQMQSDHLEHCLRLLVQEKHLRQEGNRYVITDDGREDVQKLQHLALELPQVIGGGSGGEQQRQTATATKTTGGQGGGGNAPGNFGGQHSGNQPNVGNSGRTPIDTGEEMNRGSVNKGGASNPSMSGQGGQGNQKGQGNR